jgi:anti-sigma-K factor RskA
MTLHPRDDLAAFALGALEPDEARAVRAHLNACEVCAAELSALEEAAFAIAATSERETPARLRRAIVERAHHDRRATPRGRWLWSLVDALRRPVPFAIPVALGVLLAISVGAYLGARNDSDRYARALSGIAGARVVALAPTGEVEGVRGSLVIPADGAGPYLILDLPAPPSGKTWEAWILRGETPLAAGITNERGVTTLVLTTRLVSGDGVAVTLEPAGGVDRVTGAPVLTGRT